LSEEMSRGGAEAEAREAFFSALRERRTQDGSLLYPVESPKDIRLRASVFSLNPVMFSDADSSPGGPSTAWTARKNPRVFFKR